MKISWLFIFLTVVYFFATSAYAQTILSNGTGGGNWNVGTSWQGGIVPGAGNDVIIQPGDQIVLTSNQACTNLEVQGTLNLNTNDRTLSINNNLIFSGISAITGNNATRTINVNNNLVINSGATSGISGFNLTINGNANISGSVNFNSNTGSRTVIGDINILDGGAMDFPAAVSINSLGSIYFSGISSIGVSSVNTGSLLGVSDLNVNALANATIGRVQFTIVGTTNVNGSLTFSNNTGSKIFAGPFNINNNSGVEFSANVTLSMLNSLSMFGNSSLGSASTGTGTISCFSNFSVDAAANAQIGTVNLTISGNAELAGNATLSTTTLNIAGHLNLSGAAILDASSGTNAIALQGDWNITSSALLPFVSGSASTVTFSGTTLQQINNPTGDEFFHNLIISNLSISDPSLLSNVNINVGQNFTFNSGILDLQGNDLAISGTAAASTANFNSGGIVTSFAGSSISISDPSGNKSVNFNGTQIGDATNGISMDMISLNSTFNGSEFYGAANFIKTGNAQNICAGGNIFYGPVSFTTNPGSDRWAMGSTNPDIYYNATFTHNGLNNLRIGRSVGNEFYGTTICNNNSVGSIYLGRTNNTTNGTQTFYGPVIINILSTGNIVFSESDASIINEATFESTVQINSNAGTSGNVIFGNNNFGSTTLTATAQFIAGSVLGATVIDFYRLTQLGTLTQTLNLGGTSNLRIFSETIFNGPINFASPQLVLSGGTFNNISTLHKTGAGGNDGAGGNTFVGATSIINSGTGYLRLGNSNPDIFNGEVTLTNSGTSRIELAHNSSGNQFNNNVILNATSGTGIYFSDAAGGSSTLADGFSLSIGGSGFLSGDLILRRITQVGTTAQNLTLSGNRIIVGPSSQFNGSVSFIAPRILVSSTTFNNTTIINKNGASDDDSAGGNTFNGTTTLTNSGSGRLRFANSSADIFNDQLTVVNSGSSHIDLAYNSSGNQFNGNVILNSISGNGIYFSDAGGGSTLASGFSLSIGGSGFLSGNLRLRRITQLGSSAQTLTTTGTSMMIIGPDSQFGGNVNFTAPRITTRNTTYNSAASFTKTGGSNDDSFGANTFNGAASFTNSGTARLRLANDTGDTFNNNFTITRTSSGTIEPAFNGDNIFARDVTVNSTTVTIFGSGTGVCIFSGSANQDINRTNTASPAFQRLTFNKTGGQVTLSTDISIRVNATFTSGILQTSMTNIANFIAGSAVSGGNNSSYIDGPVTKTGNTAFTFPVGDGGVYRPIGISAPSTLTHQFRAQYFFEEQAFGTNFDPAFWTISGCEYWQLDRTIGTSNVFVTLAWASTDCPGPYITSLPELRVSRWTGSIWENLGNGGTTGNAANGTITTTASVSSFSPFTIATTSAVNPLPVELVFFKAKVSDRTVMLSWQTASELNNHYFSIERSSNGMDFSEVGKVEGQGSTNVRSDYQWHDERPIKGLAYYRLKQFDLDETFSYSSVIAINFNNTDDNFRIWPNPSYGGFVKLSETSSIKVFDSLGRLILADEHTLEFNTENWPAGIYIIKNQRGQQQRLVVNPSR